MAVTEAFTGSEAVSTTEWSLTTDTAGPDVETSDGYFAVFIDLNNLAVGDLFRFRVYEKCTSAGTQRIVFEVLFADVQAAPLWTSPCLPLMHGWDMTLLKVSGTDRTIIWSIRKEP